MAETQQQKKKRKKQFTLFEQVQEETAVQNAKEVTDALDELAKQGHHVDIQVCPRCKSPKVERAKSTGGAKSTAAKGRSDRGARVEERELVKQKDAFQAPGTRVPGCC